MASDLEQSIFRTVAFGSLFDYPLTAFEIWKWLAKPAVAYRLEDVHQALSASVYLQEKLETRDGFFVLKGQTRLIETRHERFLDASRKYHRLRSVGRYLARLPMVSAVAAGNTLAWMNTKPESDIDLFIVVKSGRLWTARLLCVLPFKLLGLRPGQRKLDPLCFSFFAAEDRLAMKELRLGPDDLYLAQWIHSLVPVIDRGGFGHVAEKNVWVRAVFPNSFSVRPARPRRLLVRRLPDLCRLFEPLARRLQRPRLPAAIRSLMNQDSRVVVDDGMLKFHQNDRRQEFIDRLKELCSPS